MGIFDRIRSGLRSIGERIGVIERQVERSHATPEEKVRIQHSLSFVEDVDRRTLEQAKPQEISVQERYLPVPEGEGRRLRVSIRYRPEGVSRATRTHTAYVYADSAQAALLIGQNNLDMEPAYILYAESIPASEGREYSDEGPTRGT